MLLSLPLCRLVFRRLASCHHFLFVLYSLFSLLLSLHIFCARALVVFTLFLLRFFSLFYSDFGLSVLHYVSGEVSVILAAEARRRKDTSTVPPGELGRSLVTMGTQVPQFQCSLPDLGIFPSLGLVFHCGSRLSNLHHFSLFGLGLESPPRIPSLELSQTSWPIALSFIWSPLPVSPHLLHASSIFTRN